MPENGVCSCVPFCLGSFMPFEWCDFFLMSDSPNQINRRMSKYWTWLKSDCVCFKCSFSGRLTEALSLPMHCISQLPCSLELLLFLFAMYTSSARCMSSTLQVIDRKNVSIYIKGNFFSRAR